MGTVGRTEGSILQFHPSHRPFLYFQGVSGMPSNFRLHLPVALLGRHKGGEGEALVGLQGSPQQERVQVLQTRRGNDQAIFQCVCVILLSTSVLSLSSVYFFVLI